jgi:predicted alpha/beta-fold hydrolase
VKFPAFRARTPWWGPDLQTLRNVVRPPQPKFPPHRTERIVVPLDDGSGDAIACLLQVPETSSEGPLVVLVHGLSGDETSAYMHVSAAHWLARGRSVLRVNLRGAGASRPLCREQYHAGRSADLAAVLHGLAPQLIALGIFAVGYSLGGNMLLKFAAEYGGRLPLVGVVSVSAPIDLAAASRRFLDVRNRVYHWHLLSSMKRECFAHGTEVCDDEARAIRASRSILEFDETVVAPRNGFHNAQHYYDENRADRFLPELRVPALLIHAMDDPWIPHEAYAEFVRRKPEACVVLLPNRGGHVGFHDRTGTPWHDRCAGLFLDGIV